MFGSFSIEGTMRTKLSRRVKSLSLFTPCLVCLFYPSYCHVLRERTVVLMYHKPANVVTTHARNDPLGRQNVYEDVRSMRGYRGSRILPKDCNFEELTGIRSKLSSIGRLDADTSGLLLLTNDGGLIHHVTNKEARSLNDQGAISKTYEATIMGYHDNSSVVLDHVRSGVDLGPKYGGQTRPVDDIHVLDHPSRTTTSISITLTEGRNRQIRRMFHAIHSGVVKLKRTRIGKDLQLDGLDEGCWRILTDSEIMESLRWHARDLSMPLESYSQPRKRLKRRR